MTFDATTRIEQIQTMIGALRPGPAAPAASAAAAPAPSFAQTLAAAKEPAAPFGAQIDAAAARHGIDPALLRALVRQESGFDPRAHSAAGAMGLTQLMPQTAASLGVTDPYDPAQSLDGGATYLREMLDRFGGDPRKALAAYNAGPGAVERFGGVPPYPETQRYVQNILGGMTA
jgi:soluble lytic murein transglycosylase-like protein